MEMEGQVREAQFLRTLVELGHEGFTGAIRLEKEEIIKIIYLEAGQIISASTNEPSESVDEILLRGEKVSREHIQQALVKRKQDETLGDALLTAGFITRKELRWARRHQIVEVLRSTIASDGWHFTIVPDYVSSRTTEGTNFQVAPILVELIVTDPDRKRIDQRLDGGEVRLRKSPSFDARYGTLGLNEDADRVIDLVNGKRSATEIASEAGGNGFMNLKLLAALRLLGLLEINPEAKEQLQISFEPESAGDELLPGIEPEQENGVDVPAWDVESIPEDEGPEEPGEDLAIDLGEDPPPVEPVAPPPSEPEPEEEAPDRTEMPPFESAGEFSDEEGSELSLDTDEAPAFAEAELQRRTPEASTVEEVAEEEPPEANQEEAEGRNEELLPSIDQSEAEQEEDLESQVGEALDWTPPLPDAESPEARDPKFEPEEEMTPSETAVDGGGTDGNRKKLGILIAVVVLAVLGVAVWYLFMREEIPESPVTVQEKETPAAPATREVEVDPAETERETEAAAGLVPEIETATPPEGPSPGAPEPVASSDELRSRYDRMASRFAEEASGVPYAIQFEIVCQTSSVTLALEEGGEPVWFVPIDFQGRPCYRVFWGRYDSESAASASIDEIPESLSGSRPVVVQPPRVIE